ncbi:MAG: hypothetical protein PH343_07985 [Nitrospira sp.]|nr:hypothetical protein [Nitrospira sp.]
MEKFYLSLAAGSQIKTARTLKYPNILINFMTKTNRPPKYPYENLFIDSGGFFSSLRNGRYTKTDAEYLEYLEKVKPDFFALRDYPCEPELLKKHNRTVFDHIKMTVEHHCMLLDMLSEYDTGAVPIPVIQGWEVSDYLHCIDLFRERGLIKDYMAIGSVCRRTSINNIREIIIAVRDNVPLWVQLHGFGVKLTALKDLAIWKALYSVDSGAWDYDFACHRKD